jgi:hypothetical protein
MRSFTLCIGESCFTTTTNGYVSTSDIHAKSRTGSYGRFFVTAECAVNAPLMKRSVWPSGVALVTKFAPISPPAPGRFSTTTFCPSFSARRGASRRPTVSVLPPAANGETRRMGRTAG